MQDKTNICGDRIDYELPADLDESQADLYRSAAETAEDIIAIIAEIQEDRKDESGDICEPITWRTINTVTELNNQSLMPALAVLEALERERR
jgi:predicted transcriptional regulator